MSTTINLRQLLHRKSGEYCSLLPAGNTLAGSFINADSSNFVPGNNNIYWNGGVSAIWGYDAGQDSWHEIPNSGFGGTFGAGACGEARAVGCPGGTIVQTPSGTGTTTTIPTSLTIVRRLNNCQIYITSGTNAGYIGAIVSNTIGTNSILTVNAAANSNFDITSLFKLYSGSYWFLNAGTQSATTFGVFDRATNVWTFRAFANLPATIGTDGQLFATAGPESNNGNGFYTGTVASATGTTLAVAGTPWIASQWINSQVRITGGTGNGQVRPITANTTSGLTVATWTTTPDNTSTFVIEGWEDALYFIGNGAVATYRFLISTNTWTLLSPVAARTGAPSTGMTANWINACSATNWNDNSFGNHYTTAIIRQNGRYVYSFRGGATNTLDVYDIAGNTWISGIAYGNQMETFTSGTAYYNWKGVIYIQKDATGRIYYFDVAENCIHPFNTNFVPQGAAVLGNKMFVQEYYDGGTCIDFLYSLANTRAELVRWLII